MAKIVIDDREIECADGAPLLEVCRENGIYVSSLCYLEGLQPYAGCRMCLVEIEGARGLQISCNTRVTDGMVVRTQTQEVKEARRAVLSLILANHSDRCLTCHRTEHCRPGDICLRDDVVTHRCITCSKNYRCELQTTCELVGMAEYEPWYAEERSFYAVAEHRPADRANPFLEFDPRMCILCARCVRTCDEVRHTTAITLAERGYDAHIAFGAGGAIHESSCDFCGSCIDVCPTATLMEHPHKWVARPERWTPTTCSSCSVGCSLLLGSSEGAPVIVKPGPANSFSRDQICVRGRFHYDGLPFDAYPQRALVRRGENQVPVPWEEAVERAVAGLAEIATASGGTGIGLLGSPRWTVEENLALAQVAAKLGSANLDYTNGPVATAVAAALLASFGTEALPASLTALPASDVVVVVADDLEQTHNVASLRAKDAAVRNRAKLIVIGAVRGELDDFAAVSLRCPPGGQAAVLAAIGARVATAAGAEASPEGGGVAGIDPAALDEAAALLAPREGAAFTFLQAMPHHDAEAAGATTTALANLAILVCGAQEAANHLLVLPHEANTWGLRDAGVKPGEGGLDCDGMMAAARDGSLKALVVAGDNPLFFAADRAGVRAALETVDLLVVIDGVLTETAELAHVFLPVGHQDAHEGTTVAADRYLGRVRASVALRGDQHGAYETLAALGRGLGASLPPSAAAAAGTLTAKIPGYKDAVFDLLGNGSRLQVAVPKGKLQPVPEVQRSPVGEFTPVTLRTLFTSYEAAAARSPQADKLHREDRVLLSPLAAARLGVSEGEEIAVEAGDGELVAPVAISDTVPAGAILIPLYIQGGLGAAFAAASTPIRVGVRTPA